jgi:polyisoprenoid-binding protein YceI
MKNTLVLLVSASIFFGFTSCKSDSTEKLELLESPTQSCFYSYNEGATKFQWTAFKTTEMVGVSGTFNRVKVTSDTSDDPMGVLKSMSFKMETSSVETNNEDRNKKVAKHFFETINTPVISGKVLSINEEIGECRIEVTMNDLSVEVPGDYSFINNVFTFESSVDVTSWNALSGITALNRVCKELHTGADGVSKLWTEIQLSFKTKLKSDCE